MVGDEIEVVGHDDLNRGPIEQLVQGGFALSLEGDVTDGKDLIDEQDLGVQESTIEKLSLAIMPLE